MCVFPAMGAEASVDRQTTTAERKHVKAQTVGFSDFVLHCLQTLPDFRTGSRCIYVCGDAIVAEGPLHVF